MTKMVVTTTRAGVVNIPRPQASANCQSAYCATLAIWSHAGARRGHIDATSYCRRATTSASAASVDGLPWLTPGSCRARMSMISSALDASTTSTTTATNRRASRSLPVRMRTEAAAIRAPVPTSVHDIRPTPATATSTPPSSSTRSTHQRPSRPRAAMVIAAGAPTSALRCTAGASAMR